MDSEGGRSEVESFLVLVVALAADRGTGDDDRVFSGLDLKGRRLCSFALSVGLEEKYRSANKFRKYITEDFSLPTGLSG